MNKKEIGEAIRKRRKELNVDQPTLAALSEIGINTLVAIERGTGNPTIETLLKVVDTIGYQITTKLKD